MGDIPDERSYNTPAEQEMWQAVKSLKPKYRVPVYMYYFEGTLGMRLSRARKLLKEIMRESGYFEKAI